ncbi:MAG: NAD-dependent epimerase/dehydratase family protein [Planctomycetes bacterium]|nr:NAD-dependent epimerase/dehydratase family protein [Planctomycetota bacterium]MCB9892677.1 NAD-dependent epimerase/dehydratase family protein [Planctomycetota bacterium]MCB9919759.1 NAD-dependent epimerase/dehydratase family protein [Planctomycetota bacterium]
MTNHYIVTGALGCIGAWVTKLLVDRGDVPVVFDLPGDRRRLRELLGERLEEIVFVDGDITDLTALENTVRETDAHRIVHLAGLQVPFCKADPARGALVNVLGTIHVLEVAKRLQLDGVVYASSAAVYGPPEDDLAAAPDENSALEPSTHYGVFKRANEGNARIYWTDDGVRSVGLRPLTVYGVGRDQGLTSGPTTAMRKLVRGEPSTISFSGATDFLYVADCAAAFLACVDACPDGAPVYNLSGHSVTVEKFVDIVGRTARQMGIDTADRITIDGPALPIPGAIDGSAFASAYPNAPKTKLEDGIRETLERFVELER